jgi:serine/threonine protein kinase
MGVCLTQELLERYTTGECPPDERQVIESHLAECESCRQEATSTRSRIGAAGKPNSETASGRIAAKHADRTRVLADELPTKSLAEPSIPGSGPPDFAKTLGSMIEGFEIIEEMPRGGQAVVYKAIHTATKTHVAIKVLLPTLLASARARYYFEREAELIASLDHPNIVAIRDSGIIHHQYYFVMQYIDGLPLEQYVRSENLSFREKVLLFHKICGAITYAHQQGVIHRDLKFANILVDKRGEPHILDFGLAKAIGLSEQSPDRAVATMTGQLAGTLSTMSPEQAAGRPDLIDVRTDVYSLGVILYRLLTGQYPYDVNGSTLEVLQNIQKVEPVRPRQIIRKFDSEVEAILLTALAKEPDRRYTGAADLRSDIEHWLDGRPIRVKCISTTYLLRKVISRHRYTSTVAALLLLIVLAFAYVSFDLYRTAEKRKSELEVVNRQLTATTERNVALVRPFVFNFFLDAWRQNRNPQAAFVLTFLSEGSKEKKAARFLFDPNSVDQKREDFRRALGDANSWFAEFIIGENYLKNGQRDKALEAFKASSTLMPESMKGDPARSNGGVDSWLAGQVKNRLDQLSAADEQKE